MTPRRTIPITLAAILGLTLLFATACGKGTSGDLLTPSQARTLNSDLNRLAGLALPDQCDKAENLAAALNERTAGLDLSIRSDLRSALRDGTAHLRALVAESCGMTQTTTETTTTETETTPTETVTVPTETGTGTGTTTTDTNTGTETTTNGGGSDTGGGGSPGGVNSPGPSGGEPSPSN